MSVQIKLNPKYAKVQHRFRDFMIDLETLATDSRAIVLSIGIAFFNDDEVVDTYYSPLPMREQLKLGRTICPETLTWWSKQEKMSETIEHSTSCKKGLKDILNEVARFMQEHSDMKDRVVWGNGSSFDIIILETLYEDAHTKVPWHFWNIMDFRTFKAFIGGGEPVKRGEEHHNALGDAVAQASYVIQKTKEASK